MPVCPELKERCPDCEVLAAYVDCGLTARDQEDLDEHIAACRDCINMIVSVVRVWELLRSSHDSLTAAHPALLNHLRGHARIKRSVNSNLLETGEGSTPNTENQRRRLSFSR